MTARVLVVDDIPANVKLLEARLNAEYFDVLTAANGPEAIALCEQGLCDIVLLDVMMPDMDGFEVCRRLKGQIATAHLPVVLVTALDQPADRVRGLEAGADDFLTKPIDEVSLIARVRSLARLKVVIDELRNRANTTVALGVGQPLEHDHAAILPHHARQLLALLRSQQLGVPHAAGAQPVGCIALRYRNCNHERAQHAAPASLVHSAYHVHLRLAFALGVNKTKE